MHIQQLQQLKEHSSLEVKMDITLLQLHATITQDGANWMTCNQFVEVIVQSSVLSFLALPTHLEILSFYF